MKNDLISIVMPVYNASAYLEKTVETVRRQTCTSWELIAVDDCSTDDSFQVLQRLAGEDARIRPVRQEATRERQRRETGVLRWLRADIWPIWMRTIYGQKQNWKKSLLF